MRLWHREQSIVTQVYCSSRNQRSHLQDTCSLSVAAYTFVPHLRYCEAHMTVVPTSSEHHHSSQTGAKLSIQVYVPLFHVYSARDLHCTCCRKHGYLHSEKRQDVVREAGGHVRQPLYGACIGRQILLWAIQMIFSATKVSPVVHSSSHYQSSPVQ